MFLPAPPEAQVRVAQSHGFPEVPEILEIPRLHGRGSDHPPGGRPSPPTASTGGWPGALLGACRPR
jgi:hypothetical protein